MGAPYSAPPLLLIYLPIAGLFAWGYLCGRVRDKVVSLLLLPSPFLALSICYPGVLSQTSAVLSFLWFSLILVIPGYLVGCFSRRGKGKDSGMESTKKSASSIGSVLRFVLFILYTAAFFVSVLHLAGNSFTSLMSGYFFAAIFVTIATILYSFLRKRIRRFSRDR